jgi:hypothetical protein
LINDLLKHTVAGIHFPLSEHRKYEGLREENETHVKRTDSQSCVIRYNDQPQDMHNTAYQKLGVVGPWYLPAYGVAGHLVKIGGRIAGLVEKLSCWAENPGYICTPKLPQAPQSKVLPMSLLERKQNICRDHVQLRRRY